MGEPLKVDNVRRWLDTQTLRFSTRDVASGNPLFFEYEVGSRYWVVRRYLSSGDPSLFRGTDLDEAIRVFNEQ